jgi:malonate transporter and related proteins
VAGVSSVVVLKLVAIFAVIAIGWCAGQFGVVRPEAAATLAQVTFGVFTPALLFRTTSAIALAQLPWTMFAAYFVPSLLLFLIVYAWQRRRSTAAPTWGLSASFSNTVQLGVPVVSALYGPPGLALLIGVISLQSLVLLTTATVLAEARLGGGRSAAARTARRSIVHPVVLPILLGLAYHATTLPIPGPVDDVLATLGSAVVPVSLVTIGLTLRRYGVRGSVRPALSMTAIKLLAQPALVLLVAYAVVGLRGLPLLIAVVTAALPIGANVLLFANRYEELQAETTAAIVTSTTAFPLTVTLWLAAATALS